MATVPMNEKEMPKTKICNSCNIEKSLDLFYVSQDRSKYGRRSRCIACSCRESSTWKKSLPKAHRQRHYRTQQDKDYFNKRNHRIREEVLRHYGDRCVCCGESRIELLGIDHINGGGAAHKRQDPTAKSITKWLKKNGFPDGYEVRCHNCNCAIGHYGYCPHKPEVRRPIMPRGKRAD